MSSIGLLGVSRETTLVGVLSAFAHALGSLPLTNSIVTPHLGKISVSTTWQELNIEADATTRSPALTRHAMDANIADIPVPVATQNSAPSSAASLSSNIATVGLPKRE